MFDNYYKWNTIFKNCESLFCTHETYIILYINYTSIKKKKRESTLTTGILLDPKPFILGATYGMTESSPLSIPQLPAHILQLLNPKEVEVSRLP